MKSLTLFQKNKNNKIQEWKIWVIENGASGFPEVHILHGLIDGKKQTTFDVISSGVNEGKANATTALEQAYLVMERKITKQKEQGYSEEQSNIEQSFSIDWTKPLPKELCFFKPKNSIEDKKLKELEKAKRSRLSVKRDGLCHILYVSDFGIDLLSRRMDVVSDRFPHLISELKSLPPKTILLGEIIYEKNGRDDFKTCCSICRSDAEVAKQKQDSLGKVKYYVFDLAFYKGVNLLTTTTFGERRDLLINLLKQMNLKYTIISEIINKPFEDAMEEVKQRGLEGLVIWDSNGIMEEKRAFTLNGKSDRPNVLWKSKPKFELDAIARFDPDNEIGEWGNGKNKNKMKSVFIYQINDDGKEIFICKCGGGFTDEDREKYSNSKIFPLVFQIEFDSIISKTGSLRFPVFIRERKDKNINECVLDDRIIAAKSIEELDDEIE